VIEVMVLRGEEGRKGAVLMYESWGAKVVVLFFFFFSLTRFS